MKNQPTTKAARRAARLEAHYALCAKLAEFYGYKGKYSGKQISTALFKAETAAHKAAEDYCNTEAGAQAWPAKERAARATVYTMFPDLANMSIIQSQAAPTISSAPAFFVNGDPRGYALKIRQPEVKRLQDAGINLVTDFGGYGILSPEINGDA